MHTIVSTNASHRVGGSFLQTLRTALAVSRQRRRLADLSDDILRDIGITREQADAEAKRPSWDAPAHWSR